MPHVWQPSLAATVASDPTLATTTDDDPTSAYKTEITHLHNKILI